MKILVVDDDADLVEVITYGLRRRGHSVIAAADGEDALERWRADSPSMVLLDVGLPNMDGLEVCRRIRESSKVPIILLSGSNSEDDIISGLEAGAEEYIAKPFSLTQLALRIEALDRWTRPSESADFQGNIQVGNLVVNPEYCSVHNNGQEVRLTRMEFRILYSLAANAGKVVVTDRLADFAWQGPGEGDPALLKTHISRIRRKLGVPANEPGFIRSAPGLGYSLIVS